MSRSFRALARWLRRPLVRAFDVTPERRSDLVRSMLAPADSARAIYWVRLMLSMAIATLGLVLGSSVVVIGAMLISPLLMPIVELGMGLAVGLPGLALRSFGRVLGSSVAVVASAAAITLALPFTEVTAPIAQRASPTLLDLLVAVCCALMAALSVVAGAQAAATTAAGTALGIALVPPLCVVGFGLGIGRLDVAEGAGLLFVANFSAIIFFAVLTFTAFGFGDVERMKLAPGERPIGAFWRIVLPMGLLGIVFVPLGNALEEVAWEVRTRDLVRRELERLGPDTVSAQVSVNHHHVDVELVVLGDSSRAHVVQHQLAAAIAQASGVEPEVRVVAVPDVQAMRHVLDEARPAPPPNAMPTATSVSVRAAEALAEAWPTEAAGKLVDWRLALGGHGEATLEVVHLGPPLGAAATEVLTKHLESTLRTTLRLIEHQLPTDPVVCEPPVDAGCVDEIARLLGEVVASSGLYACATLPSEPSDVDAGPEAGPGAEPEAVSAHLDRLLAAPHERVDVAAASGRSWSLAVRLEPCTEAGAGDGGSEQ